jgi:hypothetical protein
MNPRMFAHHDNNQEIKDKLKMFLVEDLEHAKQLNELGFGIFKTVNSFPLIANHSGKIDCIRRKSSVESLDYFFCELDGGDKKAMKKKIFCNLRPSKIIETKNGFHLHWKLKKHNLTVDQYETFIRERIIPKLNADVQVFDAARVLRVENFLHCKDPNSPFMVKLIEENENAYSMKQFELAFPEIKTKKKIILEVKSNKTVTTEMKQFGSDDFWKRAAELNNMQQLQKISGTEHVAGESFEFRRNYDGTYNIKVDGKQTASWIDTDGFIGSRNGGGPTWLNWLHYYLKDWSRVYSVAKEFMN